MGKAVPDNNNEYNCKERKKKMTKIDVVSGFLGAGKTTLIKKLLKEALADTKVVLIENEFGEIGIDGGFLKESGIEIKEMNSGCICCSLVGDFGTSLKEVLTTYTPERILIEPSGVGKLSDVLKAIEDVALDSDIVVNSVVTVVDAVKCKMYIKNFGEFFLNQIENAGTIFLSRTDKLSKSRLDLDKLDACINMIQEHNKNAVIVTTPWDQLDGRMILDTMEGAGKLEVMMSEMLEDVQHGHHHEHDENCSCGCADHNHGHEHSCDIKHEHDCEPCHGNEHGHDHDPSHINEHSHDSEHSHSNEHSHDQEHSHDHEHSYNKKHSHNHDHEHSHDHKHSHDHGHDCEHDHNHSHDHDCEHDHDHSHDCEHDHDHDCDHSHNHNHNEDHGHHNHHDTHVHDKNCTCGCHDHDHNHDHHAEEIFTSWGMETANQYGESEITSILSALDSGEYGVILRAKGMVSGDNGNWIYFDYVPEEHNVRRGKPDVTGKVCVIGAQLKEDKINGLFRKLIK